MVFSYTENSSFPYTRCPCCGYVRFHDRSRLNSYRRCMFANDPFRTVALPDEVERQSMITLRGKLIKVGAKVVRPGRSLMHS